MFFSADSGSFNFLWRKKMRKVIFVRAEAFGDFMAQLREKIKIPEIKLILLATPGLMKDVGTFLFGYTNQVVVTIFGKVMAPPDLNRENFLQAAQLAVEFTRAQIKRSGGTILVVMESSFIDAVSALFRAPETRTIEELETIQLHTDQQGVEMTVEDGKVATVVPIFIPRPEPPKAARFGCGFLF